MQGTVLNGPVTVQDRVISLSKVLEGVCVESETLLSVSTVPKPKHAKETP